MATKLWIGIILAVGLLLRLPFLGLPLANDELAISQSVANWQAGRGLVYPNLDNSADNMWQGVRPDPLPLYAHPPGEPLWVRLFVALPLPLEMAVRLSTVVVGVLAILGAYLLGREAFGEKAGLIGAALFALSKHGIFHYSFRTTKDGVAGVLALFAFWLYLVYLKDGKSSRLWVMGLLGGASLLVRTSTILWIGLLTLALFLQTKRQGWVRMVPLGLSLLIFSLWVAADYWLTGWAWLRYMVGIEAVEPFRYTADLLFKQAVQLNHILVALTPPAVVLGAAAVISALFGAVRKVAGARRRSRALRALAEDPAVLFSVWIVGMVLAPLLFEGGGHHTEKYFYIAVPFVWVLAGAYVSRLALRWSRVAGIALIGLLVYWATGLHDFLPHTLAYDGSGRLALILWVLPFFILPSLFARHASSLPGTLAVGLLLAFSAHALLWPATVWTVANAQATQAAAEDGSPLVATKSEFVATALLVEDWAPDARLDRQYRYLPTVEDLKAFEATHQCEVLYRVRAYPLVLGCEGEQTGMSVDAPTASASFHLPAAPPLAASEIPGVFGEAGGGL